MENIFPFPVWCMSAKSIGKRIAYNLGRSESCWELYRTNFGPLNCNWCGGAWCEYGVCTSIVYARWNANALNWWCMIHMACGLIYVAFLVRVPPPPLNDRYAFLFTCCSWFVRLFVCKRNSPEKKQCKHLYECVCVERTNERSNTRACINNKTCKIITYDRWNRKVELRMLDNELRTCVWKHETNAYTIHTNAVVIRTRSHKHTHKMLCWCFCH